jgi:hypothetical protein
MASTYRKGDMVKAVAIIPTGPVESIRMLDDGTVVYLVTYTNVNGEEQQRWFDEDQITAA